MHTLCWLTEILCVRIDGVEGIDGCGLWFVGLLLVSVGVLEVSKVGVIEVLSMDIVIECVGQVGCSSNDGICRGNCRIGDVFLFKEECCRDSGRP